MMPSTGGTNNNGFIIPDGLDVILKKLQQTNPSVEIAEGRIPAVFSTDCN
ncbi:MAG: hypothetical protein LBE37_16415 [Sphingobacterium sp.]|jgi:hypothetical protein|nr:hypothetical protein [Sphingobacterium sp.]